MFTVHLDICESNIKCNKHHDLVILIPLLELSSSLTLSFLPYFKTAFPFQIHVFVCGIFYSLKINLSLFYLSQHPSISRPNGQLILVNEVFPKSPLWATQPFLWIPLLPFYFLIHIYIKLCNIVKFSPKD